MSSCVVTCDSDLVVVSSDCSSVFSVSVLRVVTSTSSTVPPGLSQTCADPGGPRKEFELEEILAVEVDDADGRQDRLVVVGAEIEQRILEPGEARGDPRPRISVEQCRKLGRRMRSEKEHVTADLGFLGEQLLQKKKNTFCRSVPGAKLLLKAST